MMRAAILSLSVLMLSGCHILFPEDPRIGAEDESTCTTRIESKLRLEMAEVSGDSDTVWVPTFTYDITKLSLEAIQELSGSDFSETEGTRLNRATNESSTAVDLFMEQAVDENGTFFMGQDPALYRVRGEPAAFGDVVNAGCARQQDNMRLYDIDLSPVPEPEPEPEAAQDTETPTDNAPSQNESQ